MIRYKIDIIKELKAAGYGPWRIKNEKIIGEATMSRLRKGMDINFSTLNTVCGILNKQPGDIIEYVPDED